MLLCVKPQAVPQVLDEIGGDLAASQLLISIAAGATTGLIEQSLTAEIPVVRAMPNTPSLIGFGMTALCAGSWAGDSHLELARGICGLDSDRARALLGQRDQGVLVHRNDIVIFEEEE